MGSTCVVCSIALTFPYAIVVAFEADTTDCRPKYVSPFASSIWRFDVLGLSNADLVSLLVSVLVSKLVLVLVLMLVSVLVSMLVSVFVSVLVSVLFSALKRLLCTFGLLWFDAKWFVTKPTTSCTRINYQLVDFLSWSRVEKRKATHAHVNNPPTCYDSSPSSIGVSQGHSKCRFIAFYMSNNKKKKKYRRE